MLAVAIPAYERPECLKMALRSLENQINHNFFTIVVDDCSTQDLKSICDKSPLNITYIRQEENKGPGVARQRAIDLCVKSNIEFIMFLDEDDMLLPHATQQLPYEIKHTNCDIISSEIIMENRSNTHSILQGDNWTWTHGKIYRVSALTKYNIRFSNYLRTNEDLEFNLKIKMSDMTRAFLKQPTYLFRYESTSITRQKGVLWDQVRGVDFIKAVESSTTWAIEHNFSIKPNLINILTCYEYYQKMLLKNEDVTEIDKILKKLYNYKEVRDELKNKEIWEKFDVNQYDYIDKEIQFFPQSLKEWLDKIEYRRD